MEDLHKDNEVISLKSIIVNYLYHWKLFVIAGLISLIPAILYLVLYPKTYEMKAMLRIQDEKSLNNGGGISMGEAAGLMRSFGLGGGSSGAINVDDEMATLRSNALLTKAVLALGLDVTYEKPFSFEKLYKNSPIVVSLDSIMRENLQESIVFRINIDQTGAVAIKMEETGEKFFFPSLPAQLKLEQGIVNINYREGDEKKKIKLNVTISPASWIAEDLAEEIEYDTYSETANTIEIAYKDHNKERGVDLLNTLMAEYNTSEMAVKRKDGKKSFLFLEERIDEVMTQLKEIERSIELYKLKNRMTDVEYDVQFYSEALKLYREKLIELEAQKYMIDLLSKYLEDPKNQYKLVPPVLSTGSSSEKGNPVAAYNEAIIQWEKMQKTSKDNNPLNEVAEKQIEKLRESVIVSVDNTRKSLNAVMSDLKAQEKQVLDKMGNVPTYEREYLDLRRQQEILQGVYLVLLQKKEEVALSIDGGRDKGFVVEKAYAKYLAVAPRKLYAAVIMMFITIFLPVGYLFCKVRLLELIEEYKKAK